MRSFDAMYHLGESDSKLELFYLLFIKLFLSHFFIPGLKHMFEWSLKLLLRILKCLSGFSFFLGLLASFLHMQLILTSGRQS